MGGDVEDVVTLPREALGNVLDSDFGALTLEGMDPENADPQIGPAGSRRRRLAPRTRPLARRNTADEFG